MKLSDLLENRSNENVIYDFSDLTRDELRVFVHSGVVGEESLTDAERKLLESATSKIKTRPGRARVCTPKNVAWDGRPETAEDFLRRYCIS